MKLKDIYRINLKNHVHPNDEAYVQLIKSYLNKSIENKKIANINPEMAMAVETMPSPVDSIVRAKRRIEKGEIIDVYRGTIKILYNKHAMTELDHIYGMKYEKTPSGNAIITIESLDERQICHYLPHLPDGHMGLVKNPLYHAAYPHEQLKLAVTANVTCNMSSGYIECFNKIKGKNLPIALPIRAIRDINIGEIIGFDYGKNYWLHKSVFPMLLTSHGRYMPASTKAAANIKTIIKFVDSELLCSQFVSGAISKKINTLLSKRMVPIPLEMVRRDFYVDPKDLNRVFRQLSASVQSSAILQFLLDNGAEINSTGESSGKTALDVCFERNKNPEIKNFLLRKNAKHAKDLPQSKAVSLWCPRNTDNIRCSYLLFAVVCLLIIYLFYSYNSSNLRVRSF
ncbi:MAG: hypothetical protein GY718_12665 [Lentisphaerae bacterium]|nr:hypothetical protein [Lentisphaerota bacterium]